MRLWQAFLITSVLTLVLPSPAQGQAQRLFSERAILKAADTRCGLFHKGEKQALASGYWQARGALLRSGLDALDIAILQEEAEALAHQQGCEATALQAAVARLREAFAAFVHTPYMEYPSAHALWRALRFSHALWRLEQTRHHLRFGLYAGPEQADKWPLAVEVSIPERDYADVRLSVRDARRFAQPWLGDILGRNQSLRPPPRAMLQTFWASSKQATDKGSIIWSFPDRASAALDELDPREAILLEFHAADPYVPPRRAVFEVGDYRAAAAFASIRRPAQLSEAGGGASGP